MDASAVNWNVTIDDFDSVLTYEDQAVWTTPDPSSSNYNSTGSPWLRGTYHLTQTKGASVSLNITGPAVYIYGNTGPAFGSYEIQIDSATIQKSGYSETASNASTLLFGASNLTYANHNIVLRNIGANADVGDKGGDGFLLDYIKSTIQVAPTGATAKNATLEETDPAITYTGTWGKNTSPVFSGGGSTFTNEDQASFSLNFSGSAIFVLGDKKNDHRLYSVVLDDRPTEVFDGTSGCGGAFGMTCEQQVPTIKYMASNLDGSQHTLTLVNQAGVNKSFFDLDSIVVVVPSQYAPRQLASDSSPFVTSSPSGSSNTTSIAPSLTSGTSVTGVAPSSSHVSTNAASSPPFMMSNPLLLISFSVLYLLVRPSSRRL